MSATSLLSRVRCIVLPALLVGFVVGVSAREASAKTLDEAVKSLAGSVTNYLAAKKESGLVVGRFDGPAGTSSGTAMKNRLIDELKALKVDMVKTGLKVEGNFTRETENGQSVVEITLTMKDRNGAAVQQFNDLAIQAKVDTPEDVATIEGATVAKPAAGGVAAGNPAAGGAAAGGTAAGAAVDAGKALTQAIDKPSFATLGPTGSIVAANKTTPYRLEILARGQGKGDYASRSVSNEEGLAFCNVRAGEEYAVKVYNDSDYDCAVKLTVDGLNCFEFSDVPGFKGLGLWVVPKKSFLLCRGWYRTNQLSESFLVTGIPDSAAGKLGKDTGEIGTITACYFAAWAQGDTQPPIEPLGSRFVGTSRGPALKENYSTVARFIGKTMQSSVSIRYNKPDDLPPKQ